MFKTIRTFGKMGFYLLASSAELPKIRRLKAHGEEKRAEEIIFNKAKKLVDIAVSTSGTDVEIKGKENIPEEPVVFIVNHQSVLDAAIMLVMTGRRNAFMVKKEAEKIPLLAPWIREADCIFVDRHNARAAVSAIKSGVEVIKKGRSLVVFPEGTRSRGESLGEFKAGSFKVAQRAKCPIVPVAIDGTFRAFEETGRVKSAKVKMRILPAIYDIDKMDRQEFKELPEKVRSMIERAQQEMRKGG